MKRQEKKYSADELMILKGFLMMERRKLFALEGDLETEALAETGDAAGEISHSRLHKADVGSETYTQEMLLKLAEKERWQVQEIDAAMIRMEAGDYGYCEECDSVIGFARLKAVPFTRYCVRCERDLEAEAKKRKAGGKYEDEIDFNRRIV